MRGHPDRTTGSIPENMTSSYRPTTLTSCASKFFFEKIVNVRLRNFLESNNQASSIDPHQSGLREVPEALEQIVHIAPGNKALLDIIFMLSVTKSHLDKHLHSISLHLDTTASPLG